MRPIWFATIGVTISASLNVLVERTLHTISPIITMMLVEATALTLGLMVFLVKERHSTDLVTPQLSQWLWLPICGLLLFLGDYCFFSAYRAGGKVELITTIVATFPIAAVLIKYATSGNLPNFWQGIGILIVCGGVILVVRNSA